MTAEFLNVPDKSTSRLRSSRSRSVAAQTDLTPSAEARVENGRTVPLEVRARRANAARARIAELGVSEGDVADAIRWARSTE